MTDYHQGYRLSERAALAARGERLVPPRPPMTISTQAAAGARAKRADAMALDAKTQLAPYKPMEGVYPDGQMAMDYAPGNLTGMTNWAAMNPWMEGQGFFGYQYLAELAQRAEYRHACEIWAEHAVRKWIKFTGGSDANRKAVEDEFKRLAVRERFHLWFLHDQMYGRGQMFLDFGDANNPNELRVPLAVQPGKIGKDRPLQRITNLEPMWSAPGVYQTNNPLSADFYAPDQWFVYGKSVHASRLLTIVGKPVSQMLRSAYSFGGLSLIQIMKPYVDNWLRARQSVSDLLNAFSMVVLATDMSSVMGGGTGQTLYDRMDIMNILRDNRGSFAIQKDEEELTNLAVPLGTVDKLQAQAQEQLASVSRIPLSIYLQITPTGLNATSDGETRNFYADVHSMQESDGRPALQTVLDIVQLSLFDTIDPTLQFEFVPLWEMSDKDKAEIRKSDAEADVAYVNAGVVSNEEARERLSNDETALYHGVDLSGPPPEIEPEPDEIGDTPK